MIGVSAKYWIKVSFITSGQSPGSSLTKAGIGDTCLGGGGGGGGVGGNDVSGRGTDVTSVTSP